MSEGKKCWWEGKERKSMRIKGLGVCDGGSKLQCYNKVKEIFTEGKIWVRFEDEEAAKKMPITILND